MNNWLNSLHRQSLQLANTKWGTWTLFLFSFADSSFLPLPITTFFIVLSLINPLRAYKYALFNTLGTLAGALAGYIIGHFIWLNITGEFTGVANFIFTKIPGCSEVLYNQIHILYAKRGFWILVLASFTPIPFGLFSISSGAFAINIFIFCLATLISQGIKFFLLAFIIIKSGDKIKKLNEFNWKPFAIITTICVVIAILVIKVF